jgi:hypothetical protein
MRLKIQRDGTKIIFLKLNRAELRSIGGLALVENKSSSSLLTSMPVLQYFQVTYNSNIERGLR